MRFSEPSREASRVATGTKNVILAAAVSAAVLTVAACMGGQAAGSSFVPAHPGVLTVATAFLPAPGFWQGHPPTSEGFEAGLAQALAHHLGLDRVKVVQVPFARIVAGHLAGADLALSQLTPTAKREQSLDFTEPYLTAPPGVLARRSVDATDVKGLRQLRWVVSRVSTLTPIVMDKIRPSRAPIEVEDRADALKVLRSGRADALLLDLPVALGLARAEPQRFHVLGQLDSEGAGLAAALPNRSKNDEVVDSAIRALTADGTIARLVKRWLGESENDVRLILTEST
jgi:polar amino acid transport system substrate-binding protein